VQRLIELEKQQISLELEEGGHQNNMQDGSFRAEFVETSASLRLLNQELNEMKAEYDCQIESIRQLDHENHQLEGCVSKKEEELAALQRKISRWEDSQKHWTSIVDAHKRNHSALLVKIKTFKTAKEDRRAQRKRCEHYIARVIELVSEEHGTDDELLKKITKLRCANEKEQKDKKQTNTHGVGTRAKQGDSGEGVVDERQEENMTFVDIRSPVEEIKKSKRRKQRRAATRPDSLARSHSASHLLNLSVLKVERNKSNCKSLEHVPTRRDETRWGAVDLLPGCWT
jgi:hypothetical protein